MSWLSRLTGRDAARNRNAGKAQWWRERGGDPNDRFNQAIVDEGAGGGWKTAFGETAGAFVRDQLPQLRESLQMTREDGIRRGISTGDLGTSYEGDVLTSWGRGISDALGRLSMSGYENNRNRYLDLLSGRLDRNTAAQNARNQMWGQAAAIPLMFA